MLRSFKELSYIFCSVYHVMKREKHPHTVWAVKRFIQKDVFFSSVINRKNIRSFLII